MARHPSITAQVPAPIRLYGRRVTLRPLIPTDFAEWSEVRRRNEAWLTPWEPRRPPASLDPSMNRDAFQARCAARDRDAAAGVAYGFGVFVDHRLSGEVNLNHVVRGAMQSGVIGYWIDQARAGRGLIAESVVVVCAVRVRAARPAPHRDLHRAAQPQQPAGDGEAGDPRGGRRPALPRDQRRVGGPRPLRHHRRGVVAAPRRARGGLAVTLGRRTSRRRRGTLRPWPGGWPCGASTSSASSAAWRGCASRTCSLATSGSWWWAGFQAAPGSWTSAGSRPDDTWLATPCSSTWIRCRSLWAWARSSSFGGGNTSASGVAGSSLTSSLHPWDAVSGGVSSSPCHAP